MDNSVTARWCKAWSKGSLIGRRGRLGPRCAVQIVWLPCAMIGQLRVHMTSQYPPSGSRDDVVDFDISLRKHEADVVSRGRGRNFAQGRRAKLGFRSCPVGSSLPCLFLVFFKLSRQALVLFALKIASSYGRYSL